MTTPEPTRAQWASVINAAAKPAVLHPPTCALCGKPASYQERLTTLPKPRWGTPPVKERNLCAGCAGERYSF